ncbi:WD40 repeat-containing protein [Frankia sp. QA3]|nr:WD40 repeat-containing protein [Frankia sp. QA3]
MSSERHLAIKISYTAVDRQWAEWVAWKLEDAGYRVLIQAWDFVAGSNWRFKMQEGVTQATRTIAVLSDAYLASVYGKEEWQAAHAADPKGLARKLLPVRIEDCDRPGLLGAAVSIDLFDLFDLSADTARSYLLVQVRGALDGRVKPDIEPAFPVRPRQTSPDQPPSFPYHQGSPQPRSAKPPLIGEPFTSHTGAVESVAIGPDGKILATSSSEGVVWLWDVTDPSRPRAIGKFLTGHTTGLWSVVFGPEGKTLATSIDNGTVRLRDISDPSRPHIIGEFLTGDDDPVWSVAFRPDGRILATGSEDGTLRL